MVNNATWQVSQFFGLLWYCLDLLKHLVRGLNWKDPTNGTKFYSRNAVLICFLRTILLQSNTYVFKAGVITIIAIFSNRDKGSCYSKSCKDMRRHAFVLIGRNLKVPSPSNLRLNRDKDIHQKQQPFISYIITLFVVANFPRNQLNNHLLTTYQIRTSSSATLCVLG